MFFELQSIYFEFCFWVFKGIGFTFYNYITYFASFIFAFGKGCLWFLKIFVMFSISLILSLFLSSFRFFIISMNSSGLFLL